ncbi:hypothetical protein U1Q18_051359 [Sarracenia purpurea var. burkii]
MWRDLHCWWRLHDELGIKLNKDKGDIFNWINLISWSADGTVNCSQTARNLIKSDGLSGEEKYRVAFMYCFVEDIERLASSKHEYEHPLVEYWNRHVEGKANRLMSEATVLWARQNVIPFRWRNLPFRWLTQSALKYLWGYVTEDEQIRMIVSGSSGAQQFLKYAVCTVKERQFQYLIESYPDIISTALYNSGVEINLKLRIFSYGIILKIRSV